MLVNIEDIKVNDRIRKDFGNIQELADDIKENGLINPLVVTDSLELIAGERRLRALRLLEYSEIEVRSMTVKDAEHQLNLEISENETRKDFSKAERIEYARRLERIEKIKAEQRKISTLKQNIDVEKFPERSSEGQVRDIVAEKLNIGSGKQYEREKMIVDNKSSLTPEDFANWDEGKLSTNKAYLTIKEKSEGLAKENATLVKKVSKENIMEENKIDNNLITIVDGAITTTSLKIAEKFGKQHKNVLQDIRRLLTILGAAENSAHLFIPSKYINEQNHQEYDVYLITKDGFSLLAMGFTGEKAVLWKINYIRAFDEMSSRLENKNEFKLPTSYKEALQQLLGQVEKNEGLEKENKYLELENIELKPKAEFHDAVTESENEILIGNFAAVVKSAGIGNIGTLRLFQWFRDNGYLCSSDSYKNKPTSYCLEKGYLTYKEEIRWNYKPKKHRKEPETQFTPYITGKGQPFFLKKLMEHQNSSLFTK